MADGAIALAIPGLFLTCVQYFTLVRLGSGFTGDLETHLLQLQLFELRLRRWGKAAGIPDERVGSSTGFGSDIDQERVKRLIHTYETLQMLNKKLARARDYSESLTGFDRNSTDQGSINEAEQSELSSLSAARASRFLTRLKSRYSRDLSPVGARTRWALHNKSQLESLLTIISEHLEALEELFPTQVSSLADTEAAEMDREFFQILYPTVSSSDPLLARAMQAEGRYRGYRYINIPTDGNVTAQYGHMYREVPAIEGYTDYSNLQSGGDSVVQAGNIFGYDQTLVIESVSDLNPT